MKGNRPVRVDAQRDGIAWTDDGSNVAVRVRAIDNKDRWIANIDLANAALVPVHRISDAAWVNRRTDEFGWLPDAPVAAPDRAQKGSLGNGQLPHGAPRFRTAESVV